jgi:thymidylate synthase
VELERASIDDLLIALYEQILAHGQRHDGGSRGPSTELLGVTLRLTNPRARISRSEDRGRPFSAIGELLWYLKKSDQLEFIRPYIKRYEEDAVDGVLPGAYGPRLFDMRGQHDQIANVTALLSKSAGSRRAVIQLFDAADIAVRKSEIPCTTTLQFHAREDLLHMSVTMRSNDAYFGLPHDVFCFTMLQEMMARRLGLELGHYIHHAGSMHVYDDFLDRLSGYMDEGFQRPVEMGRMPDGDPFTIVPGLLDAEARIRCGEVVSADAVAGSGYWADFIRLVQVFWASRRKEALDDLKSEFFDPMYRVYLEGRRSVSESTTSSTARAEAI